MRRRWSIHLFLIINSTNKKVFQSPCLLKQHEELVVVPGLAEGPKSVQR